MATHRIHLPTHNTLSRTKRTGTTPPLPSSRSYLPPSNQLSSAGLNKALPQNNSSTAVVRIPGAVGPIRLVAQGILIALVTTLFAAFCVAATIGAWYFMGTFANNSYKAVSAFLVLILVSNVASKYLAWCIGKLSS